MALDTNRVPNGTIRSADINEIAAEVNRDVQELASHRSDPQAHLALRQNLTDHDADATAHPALRARLDGLMVDVTQPIGIYTGAKGDGSDDYAVIQAHIDAAKEGQTVFFPKPSAFYGTSAPLRGHRQTVLEGENAQLWWQDGNEVPRSPTSALQSAACVIRPLAGFTGRALFLVEDNALTGEANRAWGGQIRRLCFDGARVGTSITGIVLHGGSTDWHLEDVEIANCTANGLKTESYEYSPGLWRQPQNMTLHRCFLHNNANSGANLVGLQDSTLVNSWSHQNGEYGWAFNGARQNETIGLKAEWNGLSGFWVAGDSEVVFVACRTDMNEYHGFEFLNRGFKTVNVMVGCAAYRDGRNGLVDGDTAGVFINGDPASKHGPVHIIGLKGKVVVGDDFNGGTVAHPKHGVWIKDADYVSVSGTARGRVNGVFQSGTNGTVRKGVDLREVTGEPGAEVESIPTVDVNTLRAGGSTYLWSWGAIEMYKTNGSGYLLCSEQTATPGAAANAGKVFAKDNGAGKTQLCVQFGSGVPVVIATEP